MLSSGGAVYGSVFLYPANLIITRSLYESDGIITSCALGYDGEAALSALSNWAAGKNYPTFHVGPLLPFKQGTTEFSKATLDAELAIAPEGVADAIQSFLDAQFDAKGESSVVYICFGTLFWYAMILDC